MKDMNVFYQSFSYLVLKYIELKSHHNIDVFSLINDDNELFQKYIKIVNTSDELIKTVEDVNILWPPVLLSEMIVVAKQNTWAVRKTKIFGDLYELA